MFIYGVIQAMSKQHHIYDLLLFQLYLELFIYKEHEQSKLNVLFLCKLNRMTRFAYEKIDVPEL